MRYFPMVLATLLAASCGGYPDIDLGDGLDEPDRTLYMRAIHDIGRSRHVQARLLLQTLIDTYPDSEFLPQAKYAVGETFYQVGGSADLAQARTEFRDYITFFPFSEDADDAQMMIAMTHIRQLEKSDRDPSEALLAETELQRFIANYPESPLQDEAKDKLRAVQEVLAGGILGVANYYATVGVHFAAIDRYREVLDKYPDFAGTSEALYRLGQSLERTNNAGEAIIYYSRVVRDHPTSEHVADSRGRLAALEQPIPAPNPVALARAEATPEPPPKSLMARMFGLLSSRPDVSTETTAASILAREEAARRAGTGVFVLEGEVIESGAPE